MRRASPEDDQLDLQDYLQCVHQPALMGESMYDVSCCIAIARSSADPTCIGHRREVAGDGSVIDGNHANHGVCDLQCNAEAFKHLIAVWELHGT